MSLNAEKVSEQRDKVPEKKAKPASKEEKKIVKELAELLNAMGVETSTDWKSGSVSSKLAKKGNPRKVVLSRYDKPVRIVPNDEVAARIAEMLEGTGIEIPFNTVTPELRDALVEQGVKIGKPGRGNAGEASKAAYEEWDDGVRFSVGENKKSEDGQANATLAHQPISTAKIQRVSVNLSDVAKKIKSADSAKNCVVR